MLARNALIFKWSVYIGTMLLAVFLQTTVLEHLVIAGIFPFLYPAMVAVMATYDDVLATTSYGLIFGVLCDTVVLQSSPYLFTLAFPIVALSATVIEKSLIKSGFLCSGVCTVLAFAITSLGQCLSLAIRGQDPWSLGLAIAAQELATTFIFIFPLTLMFAFISERSRYD